MRCDKDNAKPAREWLIKEVLPRGLNKITAEKQQAIEDRDNEIQAVEGELERIRPRCVERRGDYDNILVPFVKNKPGELFQYYMIRCQYRNLDKQN